MMMNGTKARLAKVEEQQATQALALAVIATGIQRSYRKPDLSKVTTLNLQPLEAYRGVAIRSGLQALFDAKSFYVNDFHELAKLACVYPPKELDRQLQVLHCRTWTDIEPDYRTQIQQHIIACFVPVEPEDAGAGGDKE